MNEKYIIDKSTLVDIAEAIRNKSKTTDQIDPRDFPSKISDICVTISTKPKFEWQGTTVPNTGVVEKIYFNNQLSVEETVEILNNANLTYNYQDSMYLVFESVQKETYGSSCLIELHEGQYIVVVFGFDDEPITLFNSVQEAVAELGFIGWNPEIEYFEVGVELQNTINQGEVAVGTENEKLSSVFSTTPFIKKEGTAVPTNDYTGNLYLNTELDNDTMLSLLSSIEYPHNNLLGASEELYLVHYSEYWNEDNTAELAEGIAVIKIEDLYSITINGFVDVVWASREYPELGVNFSGWRDDFDGVVTINHAAPVDESFSIGACNDQLVSLFSTTPYTQDMVKLDGDYDGTNVTLDELHASQLGWFGTPVPVDTLIEKLYINTLLSTEELLDLFQEIPFVENPEENGRGLVSACISDSNMQNSIFVYFNSSNNQYYINHMVDGDSNLIWSQQAGWAEGFTGEIEINFINHIDAILKAYGLDLDHNKKWTALFSVTPFEKESVGVIGLQDYIEENKIPLTFTLPVWDGTFEGSADFYTWTKPMQDQGSLVINQAFEVVQYDSILEVK